MVEVYAVNFENTFEKSKFNILLSCLTMEKRERIRKFLKYEDALRTLISDILIRYLLCKKLRVDNHNLSFKTNEYGKPFLSSHDGIEYNISHSGRWVVCCIDNSPVGIDIEQIKPIDISIAEKFFSKDEVLSLLNKDVIRREEFFYELWTSKESYIKAVGKGLSIPLNSFTINIYRNNITVSSTYEQNTYYFKQYFIENGYKMVVCSKNNYFPGDIEFMDLNKLYEEALLL